MRLLRAAPLCLLGACAARAPASEPAAPALAPAASGPEPPASAEPPAPAPADSAEPAAERAGPPTRWQHLAAGLFDAFGNEAPRPVLRGYGQIPHVQYRSDRRNSGEFAWYEGPEASVHGPVSAAEELASCPQEVAASASSPAGSVRLVHGAVEDELWVGQLPRLQRAKLPRGAAHGVCLLAGRRRVWLGWSTPERPSELFSVSLRDGSVAPLRSDARPGLGALGPLRAGSEGPGLLVLEPAVEARKAVVLLGAPPLARWDPLARLLVEAGLVVIKATDERRDEALALARRRGAPSPRVLPKDAGQAEGGRGEPARWARLVEEALGD